MDLKIGKESLDHYKAFIKPLKFYLKYLNGLIKSRKDLFNVKRYKSIHCPLFALAGDLFIKNHLKDLYNIVFGLIASNQKQKLNTLKYPILKKFLALTLKI